MVTATENVMGYRRALRTIATWIVEHEGSQYAAAWAIRENSSNGCKFHPNYFTKLDKEGEVITSKVIDAIVQAATKIFAKDPEKMDFLNRFNSGYRTLAKTHYKHEAKAKTRPATRAKG